MTSPPEQSRAASPRALELVRRTRAPPARRRSQDRNRWMWFVLTVHTTIFIFTERDVLAAIFGVLAVGVMVTTL